MQLTIQLPDIYFVDYQKENIAQKIKLFTALMMYRSEQISVGAACEIANVDRYTFIEECKKYKIPEINYTIDEIQNELNQYHNLAK
ncbi:MAG: UPF0175 family protein [Bacteroidales bacterium]|nr:UPF0175 family protein [Bacteroidales bacterium]MCF8458208.1 UPF0175 family protein [Bacteroidales bacterium]